MATEVENRVTTEVVRAAQQAAADPAVKMDKSAIPQLVEIVLDKIIPIIRHSTNTEPWYQSRVFWSAVLGVIAGVLGLFDVVVSIEDQANYTNIIMAFVPLIAAALALWGRYAKKPLGTKDVHKG